MATNEEEKSVLSPRQCTMSQVDRNDGKLHELHFKSLPHPDSPDLASSDYWLFADLKRILQGKRFGSNEELYRKLKCILRPKTNCSTKKTSNCQRSVGIKKETTLMNKVEFCLKVVDLLIRLGTYWMCHIYIYRHTYIHTYTCTLVSMHIYQIIYIYIYMHPIYKYRYIYIHTYKYIYIYIYAHIQVYEYIYWIIYIYIYIYTYI